MKCLLCRHPEEWHLVIPPDDQESMADVAKLHGIARRAHVDGKGHPPSAVEQFHRQCVTGAAVRGVCGCLRLILTEAELVAHRKAERDVSPADQPRLSPVSAGRRRINDEMRSLERSMKEF